jgi:hypothetical protein
MAKMSKMSTCGIGMGASKGIGMNILMIVVYLVIAYVIYQVVMYIVGYRQTAMPNIPALPSGNRPQGGCSTGTCGAK